jgi:hypothetical protein
VRSDAKAATAGSTKRQAKGLGAFFRGAFATRGASLEAKGSGGPKAGRTLGFICALGAFLAAAMALLAAPASALAPTIAATWSENVVRTEAVLKAEINPEGEATTYHFEWGTTTSYGNESPETAAGSDSSLHQVSALLDELQPGTTYHYRVVATNGSAVNEGPDRVLHTYEAFAPNTNCANQAFRVGASTNLPDCRAYEMVSPLDKNGADIFAREEISGFSTASDQASLDGDKIAYVAYKPFGDAQGSYWANQFIATRGAEGWSSHGIDPPHQGTVNGFQVDIGSFPPKFYAFSPDLSTGFLSDDGIPPLTPDAIDDGVHYNIYLRDNLTDSYRALTTELFAPAERNLGNGGAGIALQGYSGDGSHTVFAAGAALTPDASPGFQAQQIYDYSDGALKLVSVLPGGEPVSESTVGRPGDFGPVREAGNVSRAVSDDGSRIFWTDQSVDRIFARIDGTTTVPVSESVTAGNPTYGNPAYLTASANGSIAVFSVNQASSGEDNHLYEFDVDSETPTEIAGEVTLFIGAGDDLSHIYFVSEEDLAPGATAGAQNLYLDQEGVMTHIATLAAHDVQFPCGCYPTYSMANGEKITDNFTKVTPDGDHLAFQSMAQLTDYDNTSTNNGKPAVEVYLYDAASQQLKCISCNPTGARPASAPLVQPHYHYGNGGNPFGNEPQNFVWTAAWLPTARRGTYIPRALSDDGSQLFFHSFDALVPEDTNGAQDVYQWEAQGTGTCQKASGCVSLISTGKNPDDTEFIDASDGGRDVFIRTNAGIDPRDEGLLDIYDARAGGGYPPPPPPPPPCVGDTCQSIPAPPNDPTPASASFRGAGDPTPRRPRRSCRAHRRNAKKAKTQAKSKHTKRCKRTNRRAGR